MVWANKNRMWNSYKFQRKKLKILITGGGGYIGYSLVEALLSDNDISGITIYDNFYRKQYGGFISGLYKDERVKVVHGDILDKTSLKKEVINTNVVVHLAAIQSAPFSTIDHHQFDQVNNWGTGQVVSACNETNLEKFIYVSTSGIYGHRDTPATEDDEPNPNSFYCVSKLAGEKHVATLNNVDNKYIFRLGTVYGLNPCMKMDGVIHKFLFDAAVTGRISIDGNGQQKRPFIYVKSLAHILASVIKGEIKFERIKNLFSEILSISKVAEHLKNVLPDLDIIYVNQDQQFGNLILAENSMEKTFPESKIFRHNIANFFSSYFITQTKG